MRYLRILPIIIFILIACNDRNINETDLIKDNLKGNVLGVIQVEYKAVEKFGEPVKDKLVQDLFNTNSVRTYNTRGNLIEDWRLLGVEKVTSFKYYYNESNKLDYNDYFDSSDKMSTRSKYTYESDGRIKNETRYDGEGKFTFTLEYTYNKKNQLVNTTPIYPIINQERYNDTTTYEYLGDSIKIVRHFNSLYKTNYYEKFRFDKKISSDPGNDFREFTYNENGDIATEKMGYRTAKLILVYKYKYDSNGNWIELVKYGKPDIPNYDQLHPLSIIYRTIIYRTPGVEKTAKDILEESSYLKEYQETARLRIQEQYCNESTVQNNLIKTLKEKLPDWKVLLSSMNIIPLNDCKYKMNFIIQSIMYSDIKKDIELVFSYNEDYTRFNISEWKESSL